MLERGGEAVCSIHRYFSPYWALGPMRADPPPTGPSHMRDAEATLIRQRYMGPEQNQSTFSAKKKRKRTAEKKFNFEWDIEEDTSQDYNPIYQQRAEPSFFGRGRLGGFPEGASDASKQKFLEGFDRARS